MYANPIAELPAWCGEVLSPRTRLVDRNLKLPLYARSGIEWVWLIDPEARIVEVFRTDEGDPRLVETIEGDVVRALDPFSSIVDLARWWIARPAQTE